MTATYSSFADTKLHVYRVYSASSMAVIFLDLLIEAFKK